MVSHWIILKLKWNKLIGTRSPPQYQCQNVASGSFSHELVNNMYDNIPVLERACVSTYWHRAVCVFLPWGFNTHI